jgi:hypothetical protein
LGNAFQKIKKAVKRASLAAATAAAKAKEQKAVATAKKKAVKAIVKKKNTIKKERAKKTKSADPAVKKQADKPKPPKGPKNEKLDRDFHLETRGFMETLGLFRRKNADRKRCRPALVAAQPPILRRADGKDHHNKSR